MLGGFAVGKTSLVQRYVQGIFSEKYLTTVGVKIDKKKITLNDNDTLLTTFAIRKTGSMARLPSPEKHLT